MESGNQIPFWVDAICINQKDITERNRQLTIMKWIYFRADTVVVWLGKKYSRYQQSTKAQADQCDVLQGLDKEGLQAYGTIPDTIAESREKPESPTPGSRKEGAVMTSNDEPEMVKQLCTDGYWDRLWIIQELGRARKIEVCYGHLAMDWNAFIELVTLHNSSWEGPLRLDRLIQDKYFGSHTFRKLLYDHREALCKDPRDKIYGLVGLAVDVVGFPMDYSNSLMKVWTDTMEFMNCRGLLPDSDVISFGGLVKSLLMRTNLSPLQQALQPGKPQLNSTLQIEYPNTGSHKVFQLPGYVVGCIVAVGPSTAEIVSSARKADQWEAEILQNFRNELGDAHREKDALMHCILECDNARLQLVLVMLAMFVGKNRGNTTVAR
ncbi:hypothetical protein NHQ30_003845 [Ciborinia camelliae]|nr:hypothetical protein NHQ30_003845 [Ciborinia camelliae]